MGKFIPFSQTPMALAHARRRRWEEEDRSYKRRFNELQEEKMKAEIEAYRMITKDKQAQNEEIVQLKKQIEELTKIQFENERLIRLLIEEKSSNQKQAKMKILPFVILE